MPGIIFVDTVGGRRARVEGTGLDVVDIIQAYHAFGDNRDALIDEMDWLKPDQIDTALAYYAKNPTEIDAWLAIAEALAEAASRD
jgi:uncharacterized protein (DUF433 family)